MQDGSTAVVVGYGPAEGRSAGFVAEVSGGQLVDAHVIHPSAASYHKQAAAKARYEGSRLTYALVEKSLQFHAR